MEERDFAFHHEEYSRGGSDYSGCTDNDLVAICREGSIDSYEPLVRRYEHDVYRMTYALVGNAEDAYDLTKEAFITGFPEVQSYKARAPYSVVLFRAAIESSKRLLHGEGPYGSPEMDLGFERDWRGPAGSVYPGYCSVGARRIRQGVEAAIACLPTPEKLALILRDVVGFSVEQTAAVLDWPVRKAKARLSEARMMIYRGLHPEPDSPEVKRCRKASDYISDYIEGALPPRVHEEIAEHLRECRDCGEELKGMEEMLGETARAVNHKPPADVWRGVSSRLAQGEIQPPARVPGKRPGLLWRLIAIVTLFLSLVLGGGRLITESLQSKPTPIVQQAQRNPSPQAPLAGTGARR